MTTRDAVAWARIEDSFPSHPRVVGLSDGAFRLYVTGVCYAAQHLTDGLVPRAVVPDPALARELVVAGLWITSRQGWIVHDWHEWNPTADEVRKRRAAARERMRRRRRDDGGRFT